MIRDNNNLKISIFFFCAFFLIFLGWGGEVFAWTGQSAYKLKEPAHTEYTEVGEVQVPATYRLYLDDKNNRLSSKVFDIYTESEARKIAASGSQATQVIPVGGGDFIVLKGNETLTTYQNSEIRRLIDVANAPPASTYPAKVRDTKPGGTQDTKPGTTQDTKPIDYGTIKLDNPLKSSSIAGVIDSIIGWLMLVAAPLLTLMILIGGFQILFARDNAENIKKGKTTIFYAVIGFVIILVSKGAALLISRILGG